LFERPKPEALGYLEATATATAAAAADPYGMANKKAKTKGKGKTMKCGDRVRLLFRAGFSTEEVTVTPVR
jgi:hypothetical protein